MKNRDRQLQTSGSGDLNMDERIKLCKVGYLAEIESLLV